jgi:hypothetical protein
MTPLELKARTKQFVLRILKLVAVLLTRISDGERGVVLEEADETQRWLELIIEGKLLPSQRGQPLLIEANELVAIFVTSRKSASANLKS